MPARDCIDSRGNAFATTRWTRIARARGDGPEARQALADLCAAYYAPVEAFVRRHGGDPQEARDLTQEFFARLLQGTGIAGANPERGRFRSYLLGAVKHFLQAERTCRRAAKRGGGAVHVPLETGSDTRAGLDLPDPTSESAETAFDRQWAQTVLARALDRLETGMRAEGREPLPDRLKPFLLGASPAMPQAELARELGLSATALKVAIHRLRKRFRDAVKAEIVETLTDPTRVDEEMRQLIAALSS